MDPKNLIPHTMSEPGSRAERLVTTTNGTERSTVMKVMARTAFVETGYSSKSINQDLKGTISKARNVEKMSLCQPDGTSSIHYSEDPRDCLEEDDIANCSGENPETLDCQRKAATPMSRKKSDMHAAGKASCKRPTDEMEVSPKRMCQNKDKSGGNVYMNTTKSSEIPPLDDAAASDDKTSEGCGSVLEAAVDSQSVSCQNTKQFFSTSVKESEVSSLVRKIVCSEQPLATIRRPTKTSQSGAMMISPIKLHANLSSGSSSCASAVAENTITHPMEANNNLGLQRLCTTDNRLGTMHGTECTISVSNERVEVDSYDDDSSKADQSCNTAHMNLTPHEKGHQVSYITLSCDAEREDSAFRLCESAPIGGLDEKCGKPESPRKETLGISHSIASLVKERSYNVFQKESKGNSTRKRQPMAKKVDLPDDILREANGCTLTMGIIGCLPDNVQQAIKSFSIRPWKQHVTFAFPFMADMLRQCTRDVTDKDSEDHMTHALYCDNSNGVVDGYGTFVALVPTDDRFSMPIGLFTLYQLDTVEGITAHFESMMKILLDENPTSSVWKIPLFIIDIKSTIKERIIRACVDCIMNMKTENLQTTFPGRTAEEMRSILKDKILSPSFKSYEDHFQQNVKDVMSKMAAVDAERFLSLMDHLRSPACTTLDYQKANLMLRNAASPALRSFWRVWSQAQISSKVFPLGMANRITPRMEAMPYSTAHLGRSCVPVKEGLQSIIKCLKAQDVGNLNLLHKNERIKPCSCSVCRPSSLRTCPLRAPRDLLLNNDLKGSTYLQSAFHRPEPSFAGRFQLTSTPYSDALKAAASGPTTSHRQQANLLDIASPTSTNCQTDGIYPHLENNYQYSVYSFLHTSNRHLFPTIPTASNDFAFVPSLPTPSQSLLYPLVYKPVVITQNF